MTSIKIAVDLMGSESPPHLFVDGVCKALHSLKEPAEAIFIGTEDTRDSVPKTLDSVAFFEAQTSISMDDSPLYSVRRKKDSSMMIALRLLSEGRVNAIVTAGNTGALITGASILLPRLEGLQKPALLALLPTKKKSLCVIDAGGNVYSSSKLLVQYALIGAFYQKYNHGIEKARVGMLNIGIEPSKGTEEHRLAYRFLSEHQSPHMTFIGNIEGREVFQGVVDVLITNGFAGNVFLKTSEGLSLFLLETMKKHFSHLPGAEKILSQLYEQFDYSQYPGALLCGIKGIVIKCHGKPSATAIEKSFLLAVSLIKSPPLI